MDGRWNEAGVRMVYSSENIPLAMMETLVHFQDVSFLLHHFVAIKVVADEACVLDIDQLLAAWGKAPPPSTKEIGMRWLHEGSSCILKVPSVLAPESYNYLINPLHADFISKVQLAPPIAIQYDPRLGPLKTP